jgi:hypothetical protein
MMVDDVPQRCIETHTCVAVTLLFEKISSSTCQFVECNYLPVSDNLRVAGVILKPSVKDPNRFEFDVIIPASYKIISRAGAASGLLDSTPYDSARFLDAGLHIFESTLATGELVLVWAQAIDRHFTPSKF